MWELEGCRDGGTSNYIDCLTKTTESTYIVIVYYWCNVYTMMIAVGYRGKYHVTFLHFSYKSFLSFKTHPIF